MNMGRNFDSVLEKIRYRSFAPVYEYRDILTNGHFAVLKDYVPDTVKKELAPGAVYREITGYENVLTRVLEAREAFRDRSTVKFKPSGIFKSSEDGEEIVCMFYWTKTADDLKVATYLRVYYEFVTAILGYDLYHDIQQNQAYIVCRDNREVVGLLMPVVPTCYLVDNVC